MLEILKKFFFHRGEDIMSILEKLKDLVAALETQEPKEKDQPFQDDNDPPDVPDQAPEPDLEPETEEVEEIPDYLECSETESQNIVAMMEEARIVKYKIAEVQIQYEKSKSSLMVSIARKNKEILANLESLRLEYGIPEEGYTVQLPSNSSEKVIFKKD
jgi:hypothetical protein